MAGNYDTRTTMTLAAVIEGKFNFGSLLKKPFCQEANSLGTPMNLILDQVHGIGKTDGDLRFPICPGFTWGRRHIILITGYLLFNIK